MHEPQKSVLHVSDAPGRTQVHLNGRVGHGSLAECVIVLLSVVELSGLLTRTFQQFGLMLISENQSFRWRRGSSLPLSYKVKMKTEFREVFVVFVFLVRSSQSQKNALYSDLEVDVSRNGHKW